MTDDPPAEIETYAEGLPPPETSAFAQAIRKRSPFESGTGLENRLSDLCNEHGRTMDDAYEIMTHQFLLERKNGMIAAPDHLLEWWHEHWGVTRIGPYKPLYPGAGHVSMAYRALHFLANKKKSSAAPAQTDLHKTLQERGESYGDYADVARTWMGMLRAGNFLGGERETLDTENATILSVLHKISRLNRHQTRSMPHDAQRDTWLDIAGYASKMVEDLDKIKPADKENKS